MRVDTPTFTIRYEGVNISRELAELNASLTYTDRLDAQSPDLKIDLENRDRRWMASWLPKKGEEVRVFIGYAGDKLQTLDCGRFEFDDARFSGGSSGDRVSLGFLATDVTKELRTERTEPYEETTLAAIAQDVATRNQLELVGEIPDISIERATQNEETDLEFIAGLAEEYDLIVKIENGQLIFFTHEELEAIPPIAVLSSANISRYDIPWSSVNVYKEATITYQNPDTEEELTHTEVDPDIQEGETLKLSDRVESQEQAIEKCKAALRKENRKQVEATVDLVKGVAWAIAGANVEMAAEFQKFSGKYQITEASHKLGSGGWDVSLRIRKIDRVKADEAEDKDVEGNEGEE